MGWGSANAGIASAQARVSGDQETQGMLELLAKANLVGATNIAGRGKDDLAGPLTGPAMGDEQGNVFEKSFQLGSEARIDVGSGESSPTNTRIPMVSRRVDPPSAMPKLEIPLKPLPERGNYTSIRPSSPTASRTTLKRTFTDTGPLNLQHKLMDALSQPYVASDSLHDHVHGVATTVSSRTGSFSMSPSTHSSVHGHSSRRTPASQAIFTTESTSPYTILAANDFACLVFGVTKSQVRKMGILEVVQEERRAWLEDKLGIPRRASETGHRPTQPQPAQQVSTTSFLLGRSGVTANLLSKPNSRQSPKANRRAQTDDGAGSSIASRMKATKNNLNHVHTHSRGVLLCGDVVPIQKRNGAIGSASLWVKEKRGGLIWVLEEIHEDVAVIGIDGTTIQTMTGANEAIWGEGFGAIGTDIGDLLPTLPRERSSSKHTAIDYVELSKKRYFTARHGGKVNIPALVERKPGTADLRVSTFPHIAGIMVLSASTLEIISSNSVFSAALFGQEKPNGRPITDLIPDFNRVLDVLTNDDGIELVDGIVIPEHRFRRARAFLSLRDGAADAAAYFLKPDGLPAKHRDGSDIKIDAQLRVVKSETATSVIDEHVIEEMSEDGTEPDSSRCQYRSEVVFALWITYSRHIHASTQEAGAALLSPVSRAETPRQPSPGQVEIPSPQEMDSDSPQKEKSHASALKDQLKAAAKKTAALLTGYDDSHAKETKAGTEIAEAPVKKSIDDYIILEEMGQGAYGQVKLARHKLNMSNKIVLKYVTKRRILVDTWTRDRRLGTVPLEIHVLDYLRRDGFKHPNIVEMSDFFEDDNNYYIEMVPHGLPGMDLFDYIELRVNMEEHECRKIFVQVARAIYHLHTKANVVHRDIKDENVVLDGEGKVRLIDFGSAAYIKSGPFDVFVGTIGR